MCGIVGVVARVNAKPVFDKIISGLKMLEYRGYDSAGIATITSNKIDRRRAEGKLSNLEKLVKAKPIKGNIGIGHTRWATHGAPTENNAHPHSTEKVAVVHNGIIENYLEIKKQLQKKGYKFVTQTDTEVIPILITSFLDKGETPLEAVSKSLKKLNGAYAIAVIFAGYDDLMIAARKGSPLAIGRGKQEVFVGSDAIALSSWCKKICYLEDEDVAEIKNNSYQVFDKSGKKVARPERTVNISKSGASKENFAHYMLKEIFEQVKVNAETISFYANPAKAEITLPDVKLDLSKFDKLTIVACGTSFYAGLIAKYWIESIASCEVQIDIASEFRYRNNCFSKNNLMLFISQSGETADTLAALKLAKQNKQKILSIVNVPESSIARESDAVIYTKAGPEIGVASTKAFTNQLIVLACLTLALAKAKKKIDDKAVRNFIYELSHVPAKIDEVLRDANSFKSISAYLSTARHIIYIGRGTSYAIALEGALKLKEISYIHAEANAAGELKHGPIALIDSKVPVIVIAPHDHLFEKTASNAEEVAARKGKIILISDKKGANKIGKIAYKTLVLPETSLLTSPIIYAIPVQLMAYYTALIKGTDIDQPRNLAKSVTVE